MAQIALLNKSKGSVPEVERLTQPELWQFPLPCHKQLSLSQSFACTAPSQCHLSAWMPVWSPRPGQFESENLCNNNQVKRDKDKKQEINDLEN